MSLVTAALYENIHICVDPTFIIDSHYPLTHTYFCKALLNSFSLNYCNICTTSVKKISYSYCSPGFAGNRPRLGFIGDTR